MGALTSSLLLSNANKEQRVRSEPPPPPKVYPDFVSSPVEDQHRDFMRSVCLLLLQNGLFFQKRRKDPPLHFRMPEQLYNLIDYELRDHGTNQFQLLNILRKIIFYSPKFTHPYYMYHLLAGIDPYSMIGDFVASVVSSTMLSYKVAPVYYLMEEEVSNRFRELVGYPEDSFDLIFPPGCAYANILAMLVARHRKFPTAKTKGIMNLPPLVVYVSQDSHCCYQKGAIFTSIGLDNIWPVKTDPKGRMSVTHLIECVEKTYLENKIPLMVGATSGTNIFGAFDNLEDLAKVCEQYNMWLHADGALGGGVIFSDNQKHRLKGIELTNSFAVNFHKIGSANQTSTILITRHKNIFKEAFGLGISLEDYSSYDTHVGEFFQADRDTYEKYMDHSRRPDIVKLFMMWKAKGLNGLAANVDDAYERTAFFMAELKRRNKVNGKFVPLLEDVECPVIPFYYIPIYLHGVDTTSIEFKERLNNHTSYLLAELIKNGVMVITVQSLRQSPLFFKVTLQNSALTHEDVVYLLDQIDNYGSYLRVPLELPFNVPTKDPEILPPRSPRTQPTPTY